MNMKMSKKIITVILTVAVLITGVALSVSAETTDTASEITLDNYAHVLDFYEESTMFAYDFSKSDVDYASSLIAYSLNRLTQAVTADADAPGGQYLSVTVSTTPPKGQDNVYFNWNSDSAVDDFYIDAVISGGKTGSGKYPLYRIIVGDTALDDVTNGMSSGTSIVSLNFRSGKGLSYLKATVDGNGDVVPVETETEFLLDYTKWYEISLTYGEQSGTFTITVTDTSDPTATITLTDGYAPYAAVQNVRFGVHGTEGANNSNGTVLKIADIFAASGTYRRELDNMQESVERYILAMKDMFDDDSISINDRLSICDVLNKIVGYGFTSEEEDVNSAIIELRNGSINIYANEIASCLDALPLLTTYDEKRAMLDVNIPYADVLDSMDISILPEDEQSVIRTNVAAVYAADEELKERQADSVAFIAALQGAENVISSTDYTVLLPYYESTVSLVPDKTYAGVASVYDYFVIIKAKTESIRSEAEAFISNINDINDDTKTFAERYDAYLALDGNVYQNETYPGVTEALAIYNGPVMTYMETQIGYAKGFLNYVEKADYATYLSAKKENLALALSLMDLAPVDFPGVVEAKALYAEISVFIDQQEANAKAYVDAVSALDSLEGDALLSAIDTALELQASGNVLGVDGVTEANIKLNQLVSSIELADKYCEYFIRVVDSISDTDDIAQLYSLISTAKSAETKANTSYAGVTEASSKLAKAISDYNSRINKVNAAFENANKVAVNNTRVIVSEGTAVAYVGSENVVAMLPKADAWKRED